MNPNSNMEIVAIARQVIATEVEGLHRMSARLDSAFEQAVSLIRDRKGRVVIIGMGKSGIIGRKIAATLASTGTSSFFVHPGEAFHGDLGMIKPSDVAILISNSGATEEIIRLIPFMQWQRNKTIALTGKVESTLAKHADVVLDVSVEREACNNNLAPTSSTTAVSNGGCSRRHPIDTKKLPAGGLCSFPSQREFRPTFVDARARHHAHQEPAGFRSRPNFPQDRSCDDQWAFAPRSHHGGRPIGRTNYRRRFTPGARAPRQPDGTHGERLYDGPPKDYQTG
jgi:D-arabinose 5-phosphate isomerase GutQ